MKKNPLSFVQGVLILIVLLSALAIGIGIVAIR